MIPGAASPPQLNMTNGFSGCLISALFPSFEDEGKEQKYSGMSEGWQARLVNNRLVSSYLHGEKSRCSLGERPGMFQLLR